MISSLLYKSKAVQPPYSVTDLEIMREADRHNPGAGITGFLVRSEWTYLQVLEGPSHEVEALSARIRKDPRHGGYHEIQLLKAPERRFGSWSMGYLDLSGQSNSLTAIIPGLTSSSADSLKSQALHELERIARKQEGRP
ncbi:MAG: BLUF domain-containing protein [Leisingera sp.]